MTTTGEDRLAFEREFLDRFDNQTAAEAETAAWGVNDDGNPFVTLMTADAHVRWDMTPDEARSFVQVIEYATMVRDYEPTKVG